MKGDLQSTLGATPGNGPATAAAAAPATGSGT
jgi:hypothetical protein